MTTDHLDKETSISAELTATGIKASAKSRMVAAFDRLVGSVFDSWSVPFENKAAEERAKSKARLEAIEAVKALGLQQLRENPEQAAIALGQHFESVFGRQENKIGVVREALRNLEESVAHAECDANQQHVDEGIMARFERYAEDASTEELRAKWGKVLAAEIRKPGAVSMKSMRVIDELDSKVAVLFEKICRFVVGNVVIKCLSGELHFSQTYPLVSAGLLVEPSLNGNFKKVIDATTSSGEAIYCTMMLECGLAFPKSANLPNAGEGRIHPVERFDSSVGVPVYVLTDVGAAIAAIICEDQEAAFNAFAVKVAKQLNPTPVHFLRPDGNGRVNLLHIVSPD